MTDNRLNAAVPARRKLVASATARLAAEARGLGGSPQPTIGIPIISGNGRHATPGPEEGMPSASRNGIAPDVSAKKARVRVRNQEFIFLFRRKWPDCFAQRVRPFQIGISREIVTALVDSGEAKVGELKRAISYWCGNKDYLRALAQGKRGTLLEPATDEERQHAADTLAARRKAKKGARP